MTHKKTGVLAAIVLVVELLVALLSCLRLKVKSPQREEAWDASKTARIGTRRETVMAFRIRRPKDM